MKKKRGAQPKPTGRALRRPAAGTDKRPAPKKKSAARAVRRSVSLPRPGARSAVSSRGALGSAAAAATRRELYPAIEPYRQGYLRVSELHEIYYEESGNPAG